MATLSERLDNNETILLDGGVSTEIQQRGVPLDSNVWSGLTTKTHPDEVRQVHEDYIRAGSQVITANTYSTARHVLESITLGHEAKALNFKSVQLAKEARDNVAAADVWIAGSMSSMPPLKGNREVVLDKHAEASYRELAEVLAEAGVDLIIAEMMRDIENATMVIKAAVSTGLPVWIGYSTMMADDGIDVKSLRWKNTDSMTNTHDFDTLVKTLTPLGGQAAGIMHTQVGDMEPALKVLGKHWSGPKLAYAETGRFLMPEWSFEEICPPQEYAAQAASWIKKYGVQIVGGCCGTGPEHIRALKNKIRGQYA
ncbi:MAG: homocysteine S-methyltransferase family protein [Gammaproteobacteria bacterium]|nr:homocysteine S-methyltransferase family protein [Gammaproteobacteria bacterium]MDH3467916.1 homocysteine S-methyltransferase family protein [Gammaproteobacteria bacterium]